MNDQIFLKNKLVNQIKVHMKSNIISNFMNGDGEVELPRDGIVAALFFIDENEKRLDSAAENMYEAFRADNDLDDLETAEADWYREWLYETIPYEEIVDYIANL